MVYEQEFQDIWSALVPEEYKTFSEDVESNLYIPEQSSFYSLWRTPFFKWILDRVEDPQIEVISLMVGSQIGKSAFNVAVMLEYARRYGNENILYYAPDIESINLFCSTKLLPSAENGAYEKCIKKALNGTNKRTALKTNQVVFNNGSSIQALSTGSKSALVSKTSSLIVLDEYSGMKRTDRGDILSLAKARTRTKSYGNRKVIVTSTPLNVDTDIDLLYKESRQYGWEIPCPKCGHYQTLKIDGLKWQESTEEISKSILKDMLSSGSLPVWYECEECKEKILEKQKLQTLNEGREICLGNEHLSETQISIHLNALYGTEKWNKIAASKVDSTTSVEKLKEFVTQILAEPWVDVTKTKSISNSSFHLKSISKGEIPEDTFKIVTGIDVQNDRFYQVTIAYTRSNKIAVIDWSIENFDISNPTNPESFPFKQLERTWSVGGRVIEVDMLVIDTGNNASGLLPLVEQLSRVQPIKGTGTSKASRNFAWPSLNQNIMPNLLIIDRQTTEERLDYMIKSGQMSFPNVSTTQEPLFEHIKNVIRKEDKFEDKYKGARTDYRDALRYALTWCVYCGFEEEVAAEIFAEENQKLIEERTNQTQQILSSIFG